MRLRLIGILFGTMMLVACRHQVGLYRTPDAETEQQIAQAASSISQSLTKLQAMEEVAYPRVAKQVLNPPPQAIAGNASIDWSGPIQSLLDRFANTSGYRLRVMGQAPAVPILISLQSVDLPLADILRDIDFQAGSRASVQVYPDSRIIELRYLRV